MTKIGGKEKYLPELKPKWQIEANELEQMKKIYRGKTN